MFMNIKLGLAITASFCVAYLMMPIHGGIVWSKFPCDKNADVGCALPRVAFNILFPNDDFDAKHVKKAGITSDFGVIMKGENDKKRKAEMILLDHDCHDVADSLTAKDKKKIRSRCHTAKRTHRAVGIMFFLYLLGAVMHTYASPNAQFSAPMWLHLALLLTSWSLLLALLTSHAPMKLHVGDAEYETEYNVFTLIVAIVAIAIQFGDLAMTGYAFYSGAEYTPAMASLYRNPMFGHMGGRY